jgi:hypothetical protein
MTSRVAWLMGLSVLLLATFSIAACGRFKPPRVPIGPNVQANLVALFHPDVTASGINQFLEQTVFVGPADGEHRHRPGVASILKIRAVGHDGYAITFFPGATSEQRASIESDIERSPFVQKVFHNFAPADIRPQHLLTSGP